MKIEKVNFSKLRNDEHFQCQTEFKTLIEEFTAEKLKIEELFTKNYLPLYAQQDEAILKITKNSFTEARENADEKRDNTFRGMQNMVKANLCHFDPSVVEAAKRLKIVFDTYGYIYRLPLQEETSAVYNFVQELKGKYSKDVEMLKIKDWVDVLEKDNIAFEKLTKESYNEEAAKTDLQAKEVRTQIDLVFRQIIERLEALMLIEGEAAYIDFVRKLNVQLEKCANTLAQREGRNAKKKEEKNNK